MNKIKTIVLLLPFIGLFFWATFYANFVKEAPEITLPIRGYDPRNLLSGHYIEFQIDWSRANCQQADWQGICPKGDFFGINRFYISGDKAHKLERLINDSAHTAEIVFAYKKGARPVAKELLIDSQSWRHN